LELADDEADEETFRLGLKFFLSGGPANDSAKPPPPSLAFLLGLKPREQFNSVSRSFRFSARVELDGLARGILLASVIGVPPEDSFSNVDKMTRAEEDRGAGGEEAGPGELWGEEGAVLGREEGGGPAPKLGGKVTVLTLSSLAALSTARDLKVAVYGPVERRRDLRAELPNITGPPYISRPFILGVITSRSGAELD